MTDIENRNIENNENEIQNLEPLSSDEFAFSIIKFLDSKKAKGLKLLRVREKTVLADYFVICSGNSNTQIKSLSGDLEDKMKEIGRNPDHIEGYNEANWIIMDYDNVIVHIFNRETRTYYNLEKLWNDAVEVDISGLLDEE